MTPYTYCTDGSRLEEEKWGRPNSSPVRKELLRRVSSVWPIGGPFLLSRFMRSRSRFGRSSERSRLTRYLFGSRTAHYSLSESDLLCDALVFRLCLVTEQLPRLEAWSKVEESRSIWTGSNPTLVTPRISMKMLWPRKQRLVQRSMCIFLSSAVGEEKARLSALIDWHNRWGHSEDCRVTYAIFRWLFTRRLQGDFFANQNLTRYDAFGDLQSRFFRGIAARFCSTENSTIRHYVFECSLWRSVRKKIPFPTVLTLEHLSIFALIITASGKLWL